MIKAAIFDMDGTLTDTERFYWESWEEVAVKYNQKPRLDFAHAVCGSSGEAMLHIIEEYYPNLDAKAFMDESNRMVADRVAREVPVKEGVREFLAYLKENGLKLAVASSARHNQIERNIKKAGLEDFFDAYVGGDEVESSKPNPAIYRKAAKTLGFKPEECLAFEDGLNGLRSAFGAGCQTYMMVDMIKPDDELAPQCRGVYESFSRALDEFKKLP